MRKNRKLSILFILDSLKKLVPAYDSSLFLLREMHRRGHATWFARVEDLSMDRRGVYADSRALNPDSRSGFIPGPLRHHPLRSFDIVLIRKEPPFDAAYLAMTYILDHAPSKIFISNSPSGIRNANEKISAFHFKSRIPGTLIASSPKTLALHIRKSRGRFVVKPLDQKGGEGIFQIRHDDPRAAQLLKRTTRNGKQPVILQEFLKPKIPGDKRIFLLDGRPLAVYLRKPRAGEFRSNLGQGGSFHASRLSKADKSLIRELRPYLKKQGLHFVGLDVMDGRLLEINVTCPGGFPEAMQLYPKAKLLEKWADFLEKQAFHR